MAAFERKKSLTWCFYVSNSVRDLAQHWFTGERQVSTPISQMKRLNTEGSSNVPRNKQLLKGGAKTQRRNCEALLGGSPHYRLGDRRMHGSHL